jgi:hypothetical protein
MSSLTTKQPVKAQLIRSELCRLGWEVESHREGSRITLTTDAPVHVLERTERQAISKMRA